MNIAEKLISKIRVDAETGCWEWTAGKNQKGYGKINVAGPMRLVHRVSYELHCGNIPKGMLVCHRCDNRACVNPEHLFLGTHADNMTDMVTKSRQATGNRVTSNRHQARGEAHGRAKLTESDVLAIRAANGVPQRELAMQYGVGQQRISDIRSGKLWTHVRVQQVKP